MIKRVLISVYEKQGILDFARWIEEQGAEIVSTGGTFRYLSQNGLSPIEVSKVTGAREILDSRVKTLHPKIHGGILAIRNNEHHMKTLEEEDILPIDMVIVNLYPFFEEVKTDKNLEEKIEFIDIGGPSMLRSAGKSFKDVLVVCDPQDYQIIRKEYEESKEVSFATRKKLAGKVFNLTSAYDSAIGEFLLEDDYPEYLTRSFKKVCDLRYGENPHQRSAYYVSNTLDGAMKDFEQLNGKELSFNNIRDMDVAWKIVNEFQQIAMCAIKHSTPCGVAIGETSFDAFEKTFECDKTSIFGGIVASNTTVDEMTASKMSEIFLEIVIAPDFTKGALEILSQKKNLRVIKPKNKIGQKLETFEVDGGVLVQDRDTKFSNEFEVVTKRTPSSSQMKNLIFAQKVVKHVKSNAIVVASEMAARGIGTGEVSRIWAAKQAIKRAKGGDVLASDAFFPFEDVVEECAKAGIKAIIQPGGSKNDKLSIQACDEHDISMVLTNMRHFKH